MLTTDAVRAMRESYQLNPAVQELCDAFLELSDDVDDVDDTSNREADLYDTLVAAKLSLCDLLGAVSQISAAAETIDFINATLELNRRSA